MFKPSIKYRANKLYTRCTTKEFYSKGLLLYNMLQKNYVIAVKYLHKTQLFFFLTFLTQKNNNFTRLINLQYNGTYKKKHVASSKKCHPSIWASKYKLFLAH